MNGKDWIDDIRYNITNHSKTFRQLRNHTVLAYPESIISSREQQDRLHALARQEDTETLIQDAIITILKDRPEIAPLCMKLAINKRISNDLRKEAWKALLYMNSGESVVDFEPINHQAVFDKVLNFVNTYRNLEFFATNFQVLKEIENIIKISHLEIKHAIAIAIPLVYSINDGKNTKINQCFTFIAFHFSKYLNFEQSTTLAHKVRRHLENYDKQLYLDFSEEKVKELIDYFLSTAFVGILKFDVTLFIFDQCIMCSSDLNHDSSLPSIGNWYCWISVSLIILSKEYLLGFYKDDDFFSKISVEQLSRQLEPFIASSREAMLLEIEPIKTDNDVFDDVISLDEQDIIDSTLPIYDQQVYLWNKKRNAQRKGRIQMLMKRWRQLSKDIVIWVSYFNYARRIIIEKKQRRREELLANVKKPEVDVVTSPPPPMERKATILAKRQEVSSTFTSTDSNDERSLTPAGKLLQDISNHANYLFGATEMQDWTNDQVLSPSILGKSIFLRYDLGEETLNDAGTIFKTLIESTNYIFSGVL